MKTPKILVHLGNLKDLKVDILAIPVFQDKNLLQGPAEDLDKTLKGRLKQLIQTERFEGEPNTFTALFTKGDIAANQIVLFGLGEQKKWKIETLRKACGQMAKQSLQAKAESLGWLLPLPEASQYRYSASPEELAQIIVEGALLGSYRFLKYRSEKKKNEQFKSLALFCKDKAMEKSVTLGAKKGEIFATATAFARDLVNEPPSALTPIQLGKAAKEILNQTNVKVTTIGKTEIQKLGMNAYLAVSQGSHNPPVFLKMSYTPTKAAKSHIVLIGKGVTFDSGGLSLKSAKNMETMKDDMAGAAAVIGAMYGISRLKPNVKVTGMVLATENMLDAHSVKPGDVVKAFNGKTIEILNTDAEGRLTLADALAYACKTLKPTQIIDIATLTGACLVALGDSISALFGNSSAMVEKILEAGKQSGENFWHLPLHEDYRELLKSEVADLKNIGGSYGGALTAALFLNEFVNGCHWAHLDIAGPAWSDKEIAYFSKGGTGVGVRTLLTYLCSHFLKI